MTKLCKNRAVLHSIVWLGIYFVINTITGNIAEALEFNDYFVSLRRAREAYNFFVDICLPGNSDTTIIIINTAVTLLYFVYLFFSRENVKEYFKNPVNTSITTNI